MGTFNVDVNVFEETEPAGASVLHINVNPESVPLDGQQDSTIVWTIRTPGTAAFHDQDDIKFITQSGQSRFTVEHRSSIEMRATVVGLESDQTIYTYWLTVHLVNSNLIIRVDPEVDNPPPPPG
jgi:hypothetical protein